jgi:hypothetical protein
MNRRYYDISPSIENLGHVLRALMEKIEYDIQSGVRFVKSDESDETRSKAWSWLWSVGGM